MNSRLAAPTAVQSTCAEWPSWPHFDDEQIAAVAYLLRSGRVNYWTGEVTREFERDFASYVGTEHAVAVSNGTVAIELAIEALGIPAGSEIIVPSRTFLATASAVVARGCKPVFADVDPVSGNITGETIAPLITDNTRAIICVHLAGWPCEMEEIRALADVYRLKVLEDCAQAHGATYRGRQVGSLGDAAAFSFCQDKIISTGGEGGMVTTNDETVWKRAWSYKDHGKGWDTVYNTEHTGVFRWLHDSLGTNWRMTEIQGAIGRIQLRRLSEWVETRNRHAATLTNILGSHPLVTISETPAHMTHAYYKFYAYLRPDRLDRGWTRDRIVQELQAEGIACGCGICAEIYQEQGFQQAGLAPTKLCRVSRDLGEKSLMFAVHPTLEDEHVSRMGHAIVRMLDCAVAATPVQRSAA